MQALAFELPRALEAREPPERRGLRRDEVRLHGRLARHGRARPTPASTTSRTTCAPGDLLVVNVSATLPAAIAGPPRGRLGVPRPCRHARAAARRALARGRAPQPRRRTPGARRGRRADRAARRRVSSSSSPRTPSGKRLLLGTASTSTVDAFLTEHGEPIRYGYVDPSAGRSSDYQTVYATTPGSAEMPSAGRPFTAELIAALLARGIRVAPLTLHTGVSSPERHEPPFPEQYEVPETTARAGQVDARCRGSRDRGRHDRRPRARDGHRGRWPRLTPAPAGRTS